MSADTVTPPPVAPQAPPPAPARGSSRRRRWAKRLLPTLTLLLLALWFAPAVVARTELRNAVARTALKDVRGSVHVGSASLGWFAPVELHDVTVADEAGKPVASVPRITSERSLLSLARDSNDPGTFTVERPTLTVVCAKDGTNVESAFAAYLKDDAAPGPGRTPVRVRVVGGTLNLVDATTGKTATVTDIEATADVPASRAEPVTLSLTAATGALKVEASVGASGTATVSSTGFPLDALAPLLTRANAGVGVSGALSAYLQVSWGRDAAGRPAFAAKGAVSGRPLAVAVPGRHAEELRFDAVELPLDVELAGGEVRVNRLDLTCDAGAASVRGAFRPDDAAEAVLARPGLSAHVSVEVAKLAAKVPKLLRLKEGTELREGRLELALASKTDPAGATVWAGTVNTSALRGTRDGKPLAWEQPLRAEFEGRFAKGRIPTFDKLICTSDFVAINAASRPDAVLASANVYLDRLAAKLRDFVDLDGWTLDGRAFASFAGRRSADGNFAAEVVVKLTDFALVDRGGKGLREPALEAKVDAAGTLPDAGPVRLAAATATLTAGADELVVKLVEPVADVRALASGTADVAVRGRLASWKARLAAVAPVPQFALTGAVDARGRVRFASDRATVDRLAVTLTGPKMERWIRLDEPELKADGVLTFTRATRTATFTDLTLTSPTLKATKGTLAFDLSGADVVVSGSGPCVVDLNRVGRTVKLFADANGPDSLHGIGTGPLKFRTDGTVTTFGGELAVTDFGFGPKEQYVWFEPALKLAAEGRYDDAADAVALSVARAERPGLAVDAKGALAKITGTGDVNFDGTLRYDWAQLTPLVRKFAGPSFAATGTGARGFKLAGRLDPNAATRPAPPPPAPAPKGGIVLKAPGGPPAPKAPAAVGPSVFAALSGEAAVGWQSLRAYGFDVGASELSVKLTNGTAAVAPVSATFGGGRVTVAPTLELAAAPFAATLAKGTVIDRAKLTPAATAGALGYALPAIANAAQAEGELSAAIDDNRISLADVNQTRVKGTLVIHKATVGLGPVAAQVANLLGAKATTMTLVNESAVPVRVENGRVYHQNFAVRISGTTFHTTGSVGFDDSLDLVVDVPLPKDFALLKDRPVLQKAVAGKVLKVPLAGTLSKPELDPKRLNDAIVALAREGAKEAGRDLLEGELKKLLPGANPKGGGMPIPLPFGKKPQPPGSP